MYSIELAGNKIAFPPLRGRFLTSFPLFGSIISPRSNAFRPDEFASLEWMQVYMYETVQVTV